MFTKNEMTYLYGCVEYMTTNDTNMGRNKATMMGKLCDLMDKAEAEEAAAAKKAAEAAQKQSKKKATRKK